MKLRIYDTKSEKYRDDLVLGTDEGVYKFDAVEIIEVEGCKVEECTYKLDINGTPIFENDWCEATFRDSEGMHVIQGLIIMDEYMWCLDASHTHEIYSINRLHDFKIIGNKHLNPELNIS